jgi:hypothetical protein
MYIKISDFCVVGYGTCSLVVDCEVYSEDGGSVFD